MGCLRAQLNFTRVSSFFILDRLSTIIEPVMLIAVGIFVAILLLSIIQPMFGIYEMI